MVNRQTPLAWLDWHGQPALELKHAGAVLTVLLHGGQVVSWRTADGVERLYFSPLAQLDGQSAMRGGVPICFPQFNMRGPLLKHGFARHMPWQIDAVGPRSLTLRLQQGPVTKAFWPHDFALELALHLDAYCVRFTLSVQNPSLQPLFFTCALHTYLRVDDVTELQLDGLVGARCWDAVRDVPGQQQEPPQFGQEFDSVYQANGKALTLQSAVDGGDRGQHAGALQITQSTSFLQTVVWNPGPDLAKKLPDVPVDGWRHMLCVEAASIDENVTLAPQQRWTGWQELRWGPGAPGG